MISSTIDSSILEPIPPMYADYENFNTAVNGAYLAKTITTDSIDCTPSNVYGTHESNVFIYNDKIYLVCDTNKTDTSEDQSKYNIELIIASLNGNVESNKQVIAVGDNIGSFTVTRCQAAFILPIGNEIHIYFNVYNGSIYKIFHTNYSIANDTFSSFNEVSYVDKDGNSTKAEINAEQYICPHWFSFDNHSYCTAVYFGKQYTGIAYTDDFTTFNFIVMLEDTTEIGAGGEMTAEYIESTSKLIIVYRTPTGHSRLNFQQYDVNTSKWEKKKYIPDATARPMFIKHDGSVYLVNNSPYSRMNVTIWKYLTSQNSRTWDSTGLLMPISVAKLEVPCTYFSLCNYSSGVYMAAIMNNLTKIKVARIPLEAVTNAQINNKILNIFAS
jgi:hypothetical protein